MISQHRIKPRSLCRLLCRRHKLLGLILNANSLILLILVADPSDCMDLYRYRQADSEVEVQLLTQKHQRSEKEHYQLVTIV